MKPPETIRPQTERPLRRPVRHGEEGYMLIAVVFLMALLIIWLALAAPRIRASIQRDREVETMERGKQYVRAIQLYYRKYHAYPPNEDALIKTQEIRFLRKKYTDPITGKDDWKPIPFGQAKSPTAWGLFGQPLGGSTIGGIGPGGGNGLNPQQSGSGGLFQSGQSSGLGGQSQSGQSQSGFGQSGQSPTGQTPAGQDPSASGSGAAAGGPGTGGLTGQTFGGAGIIGFSPQSTKQSILVYKKKNHYNEWEFVYDPLNDQRTLSTGGAGLGGQSPAGNSNNSSSFGNSFGGNNSGSGNPPSGNPTPPAPQQ